MNRFLGLLIVFVSISILQGCATGEAARNTARVTIAQLSEYERQVDAKITAEQDFYKGYLSVLNEYYYMKEVENFDLTAIKASENFSSNISKLKTLPPDLLKNDIRKLLGEVKKSRERFKIINSENTKLFENLKELQKNKTSLKKVRSGLEELQRESSDKDQIKALFDYYKDVKSDYNDLQKQ